MILFTAALLFTVSALSVKGDRSAEMIYDGSAAFSHLSAELFSEKAIDQKYVNEYGGSCIDRNGRLVIYYVGEGKALHTLVNSFSSSYPALQYSVVLERVNDSYENLRLIMDQMWALRNEDPVMQKECCMAGINSEMNSIDLYLDCSEERVSYYQQLFRMWPVNYIFAPNFHIEEE